LVNLHYARSDEQSADDGAVRMLREAEIDPTALADFFATLEREGLDLPASIQYLSTHPASGPRVERIRSQAAVAPVETSPLLPDTDWTVLRGACPSR
jgi:predicted Zn-dependent protease